MTLAWRCPGNDCQAHRAYTLRLSPITFTTGGVNTSSINGDGTRIAFVSNRDLLTGGNTDGNHEIFLYDT
ncbi:hypothetical protein BH20ACI3_BH20ACI3_23260 [soil metagenome]